MRPDPILVAVSGAIVQASRRSAKHLMQYTEMLNRGQLPPTELLEVEHKEELICEDIKYSFSVKQSGPMTFTVATGGTYVQGDVRSLADGGYLLLLGGKSHVAYYTTEAIGSKLVLDGQTSIFSLDYDPTKMVADSAGKLVRCLVEDGAHVTKGAPFAEVEVMKMLMPLLAQESGTLTWEKSEGSTMLPGDVLATMALDDASGIKTAELFNGELPQEKWRVGKEEMNADTKPNILLRSAMKTFNTILQGFSVPKDEQESALAHFVMATSNKQLPLFEVEEVLSTLTGRMPPVVANAINTLVADYKKNPEGVFRAEKIATILQNHADSLQDKERTTFVSSVSALSDTAKRYTRSLEGRAMSLIAGLLNHFLETEQIFASDLKNVEDVIMELRKANTDELSKVFDIQRGHHQLKRKIAVLVLILRHISEHEKKHSGKTTVLNDLLPQLQALASLRGKAYSILALEARHLCIRQQQPSRREKFAKLEAVLQAAVLAGTPGNRAGALAELVDETQPEAIDMALSYLGNASLDIRMAALEAYLRGVYSSYTVREVSLSDKPLVAKFVFVVSEDEAKSSSGSGMGAKVNSLDNIGSLLSSGGGGSSAPPAVGKPGRPAFTRNDSYPLKGGGGADVRDVSGGASEMHGARTGCIICFESVEEMSSQLSGILSDTSFFPSVEDSSQDPFNALHVVIIGADLKSAEATVVSELEKSFKANQEYLNMAQIRRVSVAFPPSHVDENEKISGSPALYTFRQRTDFSEDPIVRHMEAPLAYQLELTRLSNYNVKLIPCHTRLVHLYEGVPKESAVDAAGLKGSRKHQLLSTLRYFARTKVQVSGDDKEHAEERLFAGIEAKLVEQLNVLEIALRAAKKPVTGTHVFVNVLSEAVVNPTAVEDKLKALLGRYAELLQILKVSEVELKFNARFMEDGPKIPLRLVASNPTGYVLNVDSYVETNNEGSDWPLRSYLSFPSLCLCLLFSSLLLYSLVFSFSRMTHSSSFLPVSCCCTLD
jgi:acetyl-CoA carboxylase/biotin carboxylase 1